MTGQPGSKVTVAGTARGAATARPGTVSHDGQASEGAGGRGGGGRAHRPDLQPRPGLLPGHRGDEARPRPLLPGRRTGDRQRAAGAAVHAAPLPEGRERGEGAPEAGARRRAAVARDRAAPLPALRAARRRAVRRPSWPRSSGRCRCRRSSSIPGTPAGADVEKPDEWRIDLDPMPDCPLATVRRVAHVAHEVLDELGAVGLAEDVGRPGTARLRAHRAGPRLQGRPPGRPGLRPRGRAPGARRGHHDVVAQGP